jgi:microsomal epoxide hydrolase
MAVQPFRIAVAQPVLDDLQMRLAHTRWPDAIEGAGWEYGVNRAWLQELAAYWRQQYDWRAQEAALNRFAHFRAEIDGLGLHFIHERGKGDRTIPLLLLHGWPDSFYRFTKLIPLLTDPARFGFDGSVAFDVVVPSLPGFGFSDRLLTRNQVDTAGMLVRLMTEELGYPTFGVHGGDTGSPLAQEIARLHPEAVSGVHLTDIGYAAAYGLDPATLSPAESAYVQQVEAWSAAHGGYVMVHSTIPQTLAYGLTDSPVGLAAWILQHFWLWSDSDGDLERSFSKDELLTNIMIYWVTDTLNSSLRWYYAEMQGWDTDAGQAWNDESGGDEGGDDGGAGEWGAWATGSSSRVEAPVAVALFPKDIPGGDPAPRELAERTLNVRRWTQMPRGGHFAALEEPELLAADMHAFFGAL